jgi:hypothetical protein
MMGFGTNSVDDMGSASLVVVNNNSNNNYILWINQTGSQMVFQDIPTTWKLLLYIYKL